MIEQMKHYYSHPNQNYMKWENLNNYLNLSNILDENKHALSKQFWLIILLLWFK